MKNEQTETSYETKMTFVRDEIFGGNIPAVKYRLVGNHFWAAMKGKTGKRGRVAITLIVLHTKKGEMSYEAFNETGNLTYYDCPTSLIAECDEPLNEKAAEWRKEVANRQMAVKSVKISFDTIYKYLGEKYRVIKKIEGKRSYLVFRLGDGEALEMSSKKFSDATPVS